VSFHRHDAALNVVVFGSKRWMLFPPMPVDGQPGADKAAFSKASWLNPTAATSTDFAELQLQRLRDEGFGIDVCTQHAGDLLFVPGLWHHATVNLGETVALAWRERFIQSPLSVAAEKHRARLDRGAVARPTGADGMPDPSATARLVFDL